MNLDDVYADAGDELDAQDPKPILAPQGPAAVKPQMPLSVVTEPRRPFQDLVEARKRGEGELLMTRFQEAVKVNPDLAGEAQKLGIETDTPFDVAMRQIDRVRQLYAERQARQTLISGFVPVLARQMRDPAFAAISHDDVPAMGFLEQTGAQWNAGWLQNVRGRLAEKFKWGAADANDRAMLVYTEKQLAKLPQTAWGNGLLTPWFGLMKLGGQMSDIMPQALVAGTAAATVAGIAGQAGPQALIPEELISMPAAFAFGSMSVFATESYRIEAGNSYLDMRLMGLSHDRAATASTMVGVVNAALETAGIEMLTAPLRKEIGASVSAALAKQMLTPATKPKAIVASALNLIKSAGGEVGTEVMQEISNIVAEEIQLGRLSEEEKKQLNLEGRQPAGERIAGIIAETIATVGLFSSFGPAMQMRRQFQRVNQAETTQQFVADLAKGVAATKVLERNGTQIERFLAQLTNGTPVESLYVRFDAFMKVLEATGIDGGKLAQMAPEISQQLGAAAKTGIVEIKTSKAGATFLSTDFGTALQPHLMIDPDGISMAEALKISPEEKAAALEKAKAVLEAKAESDQIYVDQVLDIEKRVLGELGAKGKQSPANAAMQARFYRAWLVNTLQASQKNMTPEEFHQRYGLGFLESKEEMTGEQQLSQQFQATEGEANEEAMRDMLAPAGQSRAIGEEAGTIGDEGISKLTDAGGARYVFSVAGKPVSVVRVVTPPSSSPTISTAFTEPNVRRQGMARALVERAQADFPGLRPGGMTEAGAGLMNATLGRGSILAQEQRETSDQRAAAGDEAAAREVRDRGRVSGSTEQVDGSGRPIASAPPLAGLPAAVRVGMTRAVRQLLKNLTPSEQRKVIDKVAAKILAQLEELPPATEIAAIAEAGKAKRGWYRKSAEALSSVFGVDAPRFAALLAATSPQTSVEQNLTNALNVWRNWIADGRPTSREEIIDVMANSVQGKSRKSVLDAWINNSVRALSSADLTSLTLSGPKVNSFFRNLVGVTEEVTNDAWMANFALIDQVIFSGSLNVAGNEPGKGVGYLAMNARVREAARTLTKLSGETWTPAEVQETVWSWAKTLYELQVGDVTATRALEEGMLTDELIASTPDFSALFTQPAYASIIEDTHGTQLAKLRAEGSLEPAAGQPVQEPGARGEAAAFAPEARRRFERRAARRLEQLRTRREQESAARLSGAPEQLAAPKLGGLYSPRLMKALILGDHSPTSVIHEMSHHFTNVLFHLARDTDASTAIKKDAQALLDWFGVKDIATWDAMSPEQQEPHWEQLAYNFEIYAFEGKAPSAELEGVFARMRRWFLGAYGVIRDELNLIYRSAFGRDLPMLTPEVRGVFDRMLASQQMIETVENVQSMLPLFQTGAEFERHGGSPEQWVRYQAALQEAREASVTDLTKASLKQMGWLTRARGRELKKIQQKNEKIRKAKEAEVAKQVAGELVYVVGDALKKAPSTAKLKLESVKEIVAGLRQERAKLQAEGLETELTLDESQKSRVAKLGTGPNGMLAVDGVEPDMIAKQVGFQNGEELVRALEAAPPIEQEIERRTTGALLSEHGDLFDEKRIEETIQKALHNEARARFVAIELEALAGAHRPFALVNAAAKQTAKQILADRTVRSIQPHKFMQAESAASREAEQHLKDGNHTAAVHAKQRQLLNHHLAREAMAVRAEVAKARSEFAKALRGSDEKVSKTRDLGIVQAARWMLSRFRLTTERIENRAAEYLQLLAAYDPTTYAELAPQLLKAQDQSIDYRDLQLEQFRMLADGVETLMYRAKRDRQVSVRGRMEDVDDAINTLLPQLPAVKSVAGERKALSKWQKLWRKMLGTRANLTIVEHLFRSFDGGKHGDFLAYLHDGVRHALDASRTDAVVHVKKLVMLLRKSGLAQERGEIDAPELGPDGYTFGAGNGGKGMAELLGAMQHMGNVGNEERMLLGGRGTKAPWANLTPEGELDSTKWNQFIRRLVKEGRLTREHFDLVQSVWDLMEEVKPLLQRSHKEITGRFFREVEARAFEIEFPDGSTKAYRGGYVPIRPDKDLAPSVRTRTTLEEAIGEHRASMPAVPSGYLKERVVNFRARPVSIDLNLIASHLDQAIRFAHVQPRIADVLRLVNDADFADALNRIDPEMIGATILPWLERSATQQLYERGIDPLADTFWRFVRRNNGVATMMWSVVNSAQQISGLSNALSVVKRRHLWNALNIYRQQLGKLADSIVKESDFMDDRLKNQMLGLRQELNEIMLVPSKGAELQEWTMRHAYFLQSLVQNQVDIITWKGAFDQAIAESPVGESMEDQHRRAVAEADHAVRITQGSMLPEDVAAYQVGSPFYRTWVQFTGWFNTVLNSISFKKTTSEKVRTALLTFTIPMIISQAIAKTLYGTWSDDDDDGYVDEAADLLITSQLRGGAALLPVWGPAVSNLIEQIAGTRNAGDKVSTSPAMIAATRSVLQLAEVIASFSQSGRQLSGRDIRDAVTAITIFTGVPLAPLARPMGFWFDVASDQVRAPGPLDALTGTISGRAPEGLKR